MIDAKELRIGNKVFENVLGVCTVTSIWELGTGVSLNNGSDEDYNIQSENINPIELTDEVLSKCNLIKYFHLSKHKRKSYYGYEYYYKPAVELNWVPLPYLHQLQNLYFVLTGTELVFSDVLKMVK